MREIEFRGKRHCNGEWVYGFYHNETSIESSSSDRKITRHHIYTQNFDHFVDLETVGQYTGLKDKNGTKIFEGDILEFDFHEIGKQRAIVYYNEKYCAFLLNVITANFQYASICDGIVIGNIYDHNVENFKNGS